MNDFSNPSWPVVRARIEEMLESAKARLESLSTTRDQDQAAKGEIRALKTLLDLPATLAARHAQTVSPGVPGDFDS